jgi:hypothetical protein
MNQNDATMKEKRDVLRNDRRVREQGSTFSQFAQSEADTPRGRFDAHEKSTVIGSEPLPRYPQLPASSPWAGPDLVPTEPALGVDVNALEPCGEPHELKAIEPPSLPASARPNPAPQHATPPTPPLAGEHVAGLGPFSSRVFRRL